MNVIAKISCYLEHGVLTLTLCKEYLNTVTHSTSVLLWIKNWTVWYIERYSVSTYTGVTNCQKTVRFFGPPYIYIHCEQKKHQNVFNHIFYKTPPILIKWGYILSWVNLLHRNVNVSTSPEQYLCTALQNLAVASCNWTTVLWTEKHTKMFFFHICFKNEAILMKFGTRFLD